MASPLRFRRSQSSWDDGRVRTDLYEPLSRNLGASQSVPAIGPPPAYDAVRFDMDDGSMALFVYDADGGWWLGNTETPSALWETDKQTFAEAPYPVTRWAQRILLADFTTAEPLLSQYDHVTWFFLPVFFSKDGAASSRAFFRDHAAGFPDASPSAALAYLEDLLSTGVLDDHRYEMASKLGTSHAVDDTRMAALLGELNVAGLLADAGYAVRPEIEVTTGHSLDFRAVSPAGGQQPLVEVTRPSSPRERAAATAIRALKETVAGKANGQLSKHGGGAVLFVDCSSFRDDEWAAIRAETPPIDHRPAVVFRVRPGGHREGYRLGSVPLAIDDAIEWIT